MKTHCYTLDLKNDPDLIKEYEAWHQQVWPEVLASIKAAGIQHMEIYRQANRLMMIMTVDDHYDAVQKASADLANPKVQEWEQLMWKYQQALPGSKPGEKWMPMQKIFEL